MPDLSPLATAGVTGISIAALILCGVMAKLLADVSREATKAMVIHAETTGKLSQWLKETLPLILRGDRNE